MKTPEPKEVWTEKICSACNGTGFPPVKQPTQPGRKMYPAPCEQCSGKGRIRVATPLP
jgi:DnaJ-class molecular chaperone